MNKKEFKKSITECFKEAGYNKNKKCFYKEYDEFYLKFDLQKSNFSDGWYVNYAIVLKELHANEEVLDNYERDSTGRIRFYQEENRDVALLEIEEIVDMDDFKMKVWNPIRTLITMFEKGGVEKFLAEYPEGICCFTIWAQEYMVKKGYIKEIK